MKVFILSNDDLSSNVIFAPLIEHPAIRVVGLGFTVPLTSRRGGMLTDALSLARKMDLRYWLYLSFVNGCFKVFDWLTCFSRRAPRSAPLVSLRRLARLGHVPAFHVSDCNAPEFHEVLRRSGAELLVIRTSHILTPETLRILPRRVWCIHSSLLPAYKGIAGEFHALRRGESRLGSTIFRVEPELDKGPPLFQCELTIQPGESVFAHTLRNNQAAGWLLAERVNLLAVPGRAQPDLVSDSPRPSYFSWPKRSHMRELRRRRFRLIHWREAISLMWATLPTSPRRHAVEKTSRSEYIKWKIGGSNP